MSYNFDRVPNRRNPSRRNKWNYYPADVLPVWVADMDFRAARPILDALHSGVRHGVLGYEMPSYTLLETVAARMERLYGWKVEPEAVIPAPGVVSGLNVAARAFCTPDKGYLVQTPAYNEFHEVKNNVGIPQLDAPLVESGRGGILQYEVDWDVFEKQVKKAGIFVLCNPHNPVGKIFSRAELRRMAQLCIENDVIIISDEIHSELLLDGQKFTPLARLSKDIENHTITLASPSKTFNVPGLFCGFAIMPSRELRARFNEVLLHLRLHVSSLGLFAAQAAFSGECDEWLSELRVYLTGNRDALIDYLHQYLPEVNVTRPRGTYLAWLDFKQLVADGRIPGSPFEFFLNEARVAFSDGKIFSKDHADYVRMNFGCTRRTMLQALERVRKSLYR
jgi:cystathionine beta-lyase